MSTPAPFYVRLLRLRRLRLRPLTTFLLFEGSVALGLVLALAEFVSWWGVVVVPACVAAMVKVNDVVATALARPLAVTQLRAPRPVQRRAVGRSRVYRPRNGVAGQQSRGDFRSERRSRNVVVRGIARVSPATPRQSQS